MNTKRPLSTIDRPVPELPVADVERAQRYYRDTLGCNTTPAKGPCEPPS
jgi:catechol-2,3-dioxygenase